MAGDDLSTLAGPGLKTRDQLTAEMVRDFTTAIMIHNNIKPDFDGLHIEVIKDHANRLLAIVVTPVDISQGKARPRFNAEKAYQPPVLKVDGHYPGPGIAIPSDPFGLRD